jgi:hypothetical protein
LSKKIVPELQGKNSSFTNILFSSIFSISALVKAVPSKK